jgi:hypothetical protein
MSKYFTEQKINQLITENNWELVSQQPGLYFLRQKDKHYMKTVFFQLSDEIINRLDSPPKGA